MKYLLFIVIILLVFNAEAKEKITLYECYDNAVKNYPASKQKLLLAEGSRLKKDNIDIGWYPKLDLNAQATYQSAVTSVELDIPPIVFGTIVVPLPEIGVPKPAKDQYKLTIDFNQMIYDGGLISAQSNIETASTQANIQAVEIEMQQLKDRVNQVFFASLLLQENLKVLDLTMNNLKERIKVMESAVKNGISLQSNLDYLNAELMVLIQKTIEVETGRKGALTVLSQLINIEIQDDDELEYPEILDEKTNKINRPEYKLFELQQKTLESSNEIIESQKLPKVFGFGQLGYGRPGLNMLSNEFDPFFFVGIKASWNIWDWNSSSNDKQALLIKEDIVKSNFETFDKNLQILLSKQLLEIEKYEQLIKQDVQIIELRKKITKTSESKLDNGVITTSDYINDLNLETQALINLKSDNIKLIQAKIEYMTLKGN